MPPNREPLKVIKVPLTYKPDFKTIRFGQMPRLYLELLENKQKVKPQLRNLEYIPKTLDNLPSVQDASTIVDNEEKDDLYSTGQGSSKYDYDSDNDSYKYPKNKIVDLNDAPVQSSPKKDYFYKEVPSREREGNGTSRNKYSDSGSKSFEGTKTIEGGSLRESIKSVEDSSAEIRSGSTVQNSNNKKENDLISILKGTTSSNENVSSSQPSSKDSIPSTTPQPPPKPQQSNLPPSLQEIGEGKVPPTNSNNYWEVNVNKNDASELQRKRDILHKFKYLKKYYTDAQIPEYNEYTDIQTLENEYNSIVKTLKIDSNVENYKKYLQMGFFGLEFLLSNVLKFQEIKGFSSAQMLNMNQYEKILVEIGEKSYIPEDKQLAPEIRLIGIILMNAAVFVGTKMLFKNMGGGLANMMGGMNKQNNNNQQPSQFNQQSPQPQFQQKKKTMRGPDMSEFEDIVNKKNA